MLRRFSEFRTNHLVTMEKIENNSQGVLALTNKIRMEAKGVKDIGIPLDAFPQKLQDIIFEVARIEQFDLEYLTLSMLSAAATAIGNSCHIRIRGSWKSCPALYVILIGRPGQGKTPPLDYAFRPLQEHDFLLVSKFIEENKRYAELNAGNKVNATDTDKPVLVQTILSDLTQEAMMRIHNDNQRGVVILVDEIMGFFNSIYRYNDSPLLTQLLTAYSGKPLKVSRCNNPVPIIILHPCINIIGTTQTQRIGELFTKENVSSGLIDRILFLHPKNREIPKMEENQNAVSQGNDKAESVYRKWKAIINKLLALEPDHDEKGVIIPKVLDMIEDAYRFFAQWKNALVEKANSIEDERLIDSRMMKADSNVARLALVFQLLGWACDEIHMPHIDVRSVQAAIRMYEYLELSYQSIKSHIQTDSMPPLKKAFLDLVQPDFTTADAIKAGAEIGICESTVKKDLTKMCEERILQKTAHGVYKKLL